MKDPVVVFGWRRGFSLPGNPKMQPGETGVVRDVYAGTGKFRAGVTQASRDGAGTNDGFRDSLSERGAPMPPWMEILLNVIGYAGFIGIAIYHKPSDKNPRER
jgi:hypothetical protein